MCNAFSCICPEDGPVVWKLGVDSHAGLIRSAGFRDDTNDPKHMTFAKIEITPDNENYRKPDRWTLHIDETITPKWWGKAYEAACWDAHRIWCKQLYKILDKKKKIVNPFKTIKPPKKITKKHIKLLQRWASVVDSVGDSAGRSVWTSVRASVHASVVVDVWTSVQPSVVVDVWNDVEASATAQAGGLFGLARDQWKYTKKLTGGSYPFQSAVDLWESGLVSSFDGKKWRLHGGPKAKVLFEIGAKELKAYK